MPMVDRCEVTGLVDCKQRGCEIHYMLAPVRLFVPSDVRKPQPIAFPIGMESTPCQTRTFSTTLVGLQHGCIKIVASLRNRPTKSVWRNGRLETVWADATVKHVRRVDTELESYLP